MTRAQFFEEVSTWWELMDFCSDQRCDLCEDIYDDEARDDYINDCLMDWAREDSWEELLSRLQDIPTGYEYYRLDYGEWEGLNDGSDFDEMRDEVAEWMDENGYWDDEEEEDDDEEDAPYIDLEDAEPIDDEDCSLGELFEGSVARIQAISEEEIEAARETEQALHDFLSFAS